MAVVDIGEHFAVEELATLLLIGIPLWLLTWFGLERRINSGDAEEQRTPIRRIYLLLLLGVGSIVAVGALIPTLASSIQDALNSEFGWETLHSNQVGLALVLTVSSVAWYHLTLYRHDRREMIPPPSMAPARSVILVSSNGVDLASELAIKTGASVMRWHRIDGLTDAAVDAEALAEQIRSSTAEDLLIVLGPTGLQLVPFEA